MTTLPKALLKELPQYANERAKYTAKEAVLALLANATEPVSTKDMMIYVYRLNKTVTKRTYLYQMLYRLRKTGLVAEGIKNEMQVGDTSATKGFVITEEGRMQARPYVEVPND